LAAACLIFVAKTLNAASGLAGASSSLIDSSANTLGRGAPIKSAAQLSGKSKLCCIPSTYIDQLSALFCANMYLS